MKFKKEWYRNPLAQAALNCGVKTRQEMVAKVHEITQLCMMLNIPDEVVDAAYPKAEAVLKGFIKGFEICHIGHEFNHWKDWDDLNRVYYYYVWCFMQAMDLEAMCSETK